MSETPRDERSRLLVLNCGSSTIKSALFATVDYERVRDIRVTHIGSPQCELQMDGETQPLDAQTDFRSAVERVLEEYLRGPGPTDTVSAVGHRVVHGGESFVRPTLLDQATVRRLAQIELAPLHNPAALGAIRLARAALPNVPHVAVFDTAFHRTLPPLAREYALPETIRSEFGIRRYGFHGISHADVAERVGGDRVISCHLGNGASITAIERGKSIETSMGMTPLEGLVMGTRPGDLDPGVLLHLLDRGKSPAELARLLNSESGLLGLTGTQNMAEIEQRAGMGDEACRLAIALYAHRIRKYIGAFAAVMGGVDAIAFTAGIGEHSATIRQRSLERLDFLGVAVDENRNRAVRLSAHEPLADISQQSSRVRLVVVRADEELAIAKQIEKPGA